MLLQGEIPADWGSPGSFPMLQRANLGGNQLRGTLPQMQMGAMGALGVSAKFGSVVPPGSRAGPRCCGAHADSHQDIVQGLWSCWGSLAMACLVSVDTLVRCEPEQGLVRSVPA